MSAEVTVLVFGPLRERLGIAELRERGATIAEVWSHMAEAHGLTAVPDGVRAALNLQYCDWDSAVTQGDVVAFLPPVAGGSGALALERARVHIASVPIDVADASSVGGSGDGAVAVFVGRVRDHSDGHLVHGIDYEAYAEMADSEMRNIAADLLARGEISYVAITHRVGTLAVGDVSVVVAVAAPHRAAALAACQDAIDMVKKTVPIWKREHRDDGARWVDARHGASLGARR